MFKQDGLTLIRQDVRKLIKINCFSLPGVKCLNSLGATFHSGIFLFFMWADWRV